MVAFFTQTEATRSYDIGILPMTGDRKPRFLVAGPADENGGTFSPDGRWLAYFSNESGQWEDYVVPYPGPGGKWQISSGGNGGPFCFWNGNGQLIILSHDRKVLAVDLTARGGSLEVGASHRIFGDTAMPDVRSRLFARSPAIPHRGPGRRAETSPDHAGDQLDGSC